MECALTSPRFGARAAPGLGEGRLGALRRPRLRRRGRGGAPGAAIHWLECLATPLGERPEAWASVPNRPGRGSRDSEVSAARKLLTNRRCLARPSRPCNQVLTTLSQDPPLLGPDAPPRLLCPRRPRALPRVWASRWRPAWRVGPVASSFLSLFLLRSFSRRLPVHWPAWQLAVCPLAAQLHHRPICRFHLPCIFSDLSQRLTRCKPG